jgi:hypothetical protein
MDLGTTAPRRGSASAGVVSAVSSGKAAELPTSTLDQDIENEPGVARAAWRVAALVPADKPLVTLRGSSTGAATASLWRMHDKLPFCVFANCGERAFVFDVVADTVGRTLEQPFVATAADMRGGIVALGVSGGTQVMRVDWASDGAAGGGGGGGGGTWQLYPLEGATGRGQVRCAVEAVACSPGEKLFGAAETHSFHLWDYTRAQPMLSVAAWALGVRSSCASVDGTAGTQCLLGSRRGGVLMLDYRLKNKSSGFAWRLPDAHGAEGVSDLAWHPHVAHWFATAGCDGRVRLWDARATRAPVGEVSLAHAGGVAGLAWCPGHSELLATVGTDRSAALWNWRLEPAGRLRVQGFGEHRLLGVGWTEGAMVAGDARGNLAMGTPTSALLQSMCPRSARQKEEPIRRLLYARDLAAAFPLVVERAQHLLQVNQPEEALELVELCYPRRLAASELAGPEEAPAAFARDLVATAQFLPPQFAMPAQVEGSLRAIKRLRMLLLLQQMRAKELWREAMGVTDELAKYLRKGAAKEGGPEIGPETVRDTVAMVLRHHHLGGLTMGAKLLRALREEDFARFGILTRLLLSPTVFDGYAGGGGLAQASGDLEYVLGSAKVGLSQVDFVRDFAARMWASEAPFARIEKMMKKTEHTLVSVCATVNRVYLGSLLQTGAYAKFFAAAATVVQAAPHCDLSGSVLGAVLVPRAAALACDWALALLEELRAAFVLGTARTLIQLLAIMLTSRVAPMLSKTATDTAGRVLSSLVKSVQDASSAAALQQVVTDAGASQSDDIKTALTVLALRQVSTQLKK